MKTELDQRVKDGWINVTKSGNLSLYNYSNRCVFERGWDEYTMAARGLVVDETGRILARPWPKFFNLGERPDDKLPTETPELSKKYDGSLLIVFYDDLSQRWRAVTRGCWDNIQTKYANLWLKKHSWKLDLGMTYLFELVAPWNRIVVAYGKEDMILLGAVDTQTGVDWSYAKARGFALERELSPVEYEVRPLDSVKLDDPAIKNEEGFVARFSNGVRVKLKYAQYIYLHKIMTGLSVKGIWEILASGNEPDLSAVPDEFMTWYKAQRDKIKDGFAIVEAEAKRIFQAVGTLPTRKDYALEFMKHPKVSGALFRMLDGKNYADVLWKRVKPLAHEVFKVDEL